MAGDTRLPLFPLPGIVHFPRTELRLHIEAPEPLRLVHEVTELDEDSRWLGVVVLKPGARPDAEGRPAIFAGGTASRVVDVESLPEGGSYVVLQGEFRFTLEREVGGGRHRSAVVRPVEEPRLDERDAGLVAVRTAILDLLRWIWDELGEERSPLSAREIEAFTRGSVFEELVNRIAAELDLPLLRKLELLTESLPERGLSVLQILRGRRQVIDQLRPFRRLSGGSQFN
jgi:hypothetical protein